MRGDGLGLEIIASAGDCAASWQATEDDATRPARSRGHRTGSARPASRARPGRSPRPRCRFPRTARAGRPARETRLGPCLHPAGTTTDRRSGPPGSRTWNSSRRVLVVEQEHAGDPATDDRLRVHELGPSAARATLSILMAVSDGRRSMTNRSALPAALDPSGSATGDIDEAEDPRHRRIGGRRRRCRVRRGRRIARQRRIDHSVPDRPRDDRRRRRRRGRDRAPSPRAPRTAWRSGRRPTSPAPTRPPARRPGP